MIVTDTASAVEAATHPRTCQCDCRRWAHEVYRVCEIDPPQQSLVRMFFVDTLNPRGTYAREVCRVCSVHIESARQRGGERITADPALTG